MAASRSPELRLHHWRSSGGAPQDGKGQLARGNSGKLVRREKGCAFILNCKDHAEVRI